MGRKRMMNGDHTVDSCDLPEAWASCLPTRRRPTLDDGARCAPSRPRPMSVVRPIRDTDPALEPGIHWELFHGHRVYFAVDSRGSRLPFVGVPIGLETERDVIGRLVNCLDVADPRPRAVPVDRQVALRMGVDRPLPPVPPAERPALRLIRPARRERLSR